MKPDKCVEENKPGFPGIFIEAVSATFQNVSYFFILNQEDMMSRVASLTDPRKSVLTKILFLTAALALIISLSVAQAQAKASTVTTDFQFDPNLTAFVPCAARGAGEYVQISGPLHIIFQTTLDGKGGYQTKYDFQPKGVTGTGLATGNIYRGTGTAQGTLHGRIGTTDSFSDSFKMTGKGGNFVLRVDARVNVTPQGQVIVTVDNLSVSCKRPGYPSYP